jgi:hypothetical protein
MKLTGLQAVIWEAHTKSGISVKTLARRFDITEEEMQRYIDRILHEERPARLDTIGTIENPIKYNLTEQYLLNLIALNHSL